MATHTISKTDVARKLSDHAKAMIAKAREEFPVKARSSHGEKYDYSRVEYVNSVTKVEIVCPTHGPFWQIPNIHLNGSGCPPCGGRCPEYASEQFIDRAIEVHGSKYDYSAAVYVDSTTKVKIACPRHGVFWKTPASHLSGVGCPDCRVFSESKFLEKAKTVHGSRYCYENMDWKGLERPINVVCRVHGEFILNTARQHLSGHNCIECARVGKGRARKRSTFKRWIVRCNVVHNRKYDYSKVIYKGQKEHVEIVCPEHGSFWQSPSAHSRQGCRCCGNEKRFATINAPMIEQAKEKFFSESPVIHGGKYDYRKSVYVNSQTKLEIICPDHGPFWQTPNHHVSRQHGCPACSESHGEREVARWLRGNNIPFTPQKRFKDCRNIKPLPFDFYVPLFTLIEYDGAGHFDKEFCNRVGWDFENTIKRDKIKNEWCSRKGYTLVRLRKPDLDCLDDVLDFLKDA